VEQERERGKSKEEKHSEGETGSVHEREAVVFESFHRRKKKKCGCKLLPFKSTFFLLASSNNLRYSEVLARLMHLFFFLNR